MSSLRSRSRRAAAAVVAVLVLTGSAGAGAAASADPTAVTRSWTLFRWQDRRITESSGLLERGRLVYTVNDSGDGPVTYAVDARTGRTVGVARYSSGDVQDVEAMATGRGGVMWVGDIGDNNVDRPSVAVYRTRGLPPAARRQALHTGKEADVPVPARRYPLVYPDAPHNAETLLVDPRDGRVLVVTKDVQGGTVYAAPRALRTGVANRLAPVASVPGLVTDGCFFPDGRHVVLRTYTAATVYTFPGWRPVATVRLPAQRQGEGITVARDGRVLVSTEGPYSAVQVVALPGLPFHRPSRLPPRPPAAGADGDGGPGSLSTGDGAGAWAAGGLVVVVFLGWLAFTAARPRSRRRQ